jgi:hypothetical protein
MNRRGFLCRSAGLTAAAVWGIAPGRDRHTSCRTATRRRAGASACRWSITGHAENRRYFTDGSGKAIYLTGSHTWFNPGTGKAAAAGTTDGGARRELTSPFDGDAVVYVYVTDGRPRG